MECPLKRLWIQLLYLSAGSFFKECTAYPVDLNNAGGGEEIWGPALASVALLGACAVLALLGCVCCRRTKSPPFQEFTDTASNHSLSTAGFVNPLAGVSTPTASTEFTIFPPPGVTQAPTLSAELPSVRFEPLPDIRPRSLEVSVDIEPPTTVVLPQTPLRPAAFSSAAPSPCELLDEPSFPRDRLTFLRELGNGWFGKVVEGDALESGGNNKVARVAVRILRDDASSLDQALFLREVANLRALSHFNLLRVLGCCCETQPLLIIMDLHPKGDLKSYLLEHKLQAQELAEIGEVTRIMCELAAGLEHMARAGFIHTDLAARNCQLASDLTLKIGDYGTSIEKYRNEYYCAGDVAVPIRWCAPESLVCTELTIETQQVTSAANVWTLGVVLWEILEFGQLPHSKLSDDDVILTVLGPPHHILPAPSLSLPYSQYLYHLMRLCWSSEAERPSVGQILAMLQHLHSSRSQSGDSNESFEQRWALLRPNKTGDYSLNLSSIEHSLEPQDFTPSPSLPEKQFLSNKSPSLQNLTGSLEDLNKEPVKPHIELEEIRIEINEIFSNAQARVAELNHDIFSSLTSEDEDTRKICEAIQDLDDALALEKTSSSSESSKESTPRLKHKTNSSTVLDFRLQQNSNSDSEEESWKLKVERGDFTEQVRQKSRSVQDLMVLTHIIDSSSEHSSDDAETSRILVSKEPFKSEGNICGAVVIEGLLDSFRQLQKLAKIDDHDDHVAAASIISPSHEFLDSSSSKYLISEDNSDKFSDILSNTHDLQHDITVRNEIKNNLLLNFDNLDNTQVDSSSCSVTTSTDDSDLTILMNPNLDTPIEFDGYAEELLSDDGVELAVKNLETNEDLSPNSPHHINNEPQTEVLQGNLGDSTTETEVNYFDECNTKNLCRETEVFNCESETKENLDCGNLKPAHDNLMSGLENVENSSQSLVNELVKLNNSIQDEYLNSETPIELEIHKQDVLPVDNIPKTLDTEELVKQRSFESNTAKVENKWKVEEFPVKDEVSENLKSFDCGSEINAEKSFINMLSEVPASDGNIETSVITKSVKPNTNNFDVKLTECGGSDLVESIKEDYNESDIKNRQEISNVVKIDTEKSSTELLCYLDQQIVKSEESKHLEPETIKSVEINGSCLDKNLDSEESNNSKTLSSNNEFLLPNENILDVGSCGPEYCNLEPNSNDVQATRKDAECINIDNNSESSDSAINTESCGEAGFNLGLQIHEDTIHQEKHSELNLLHKEPITSNIIGSDDSDNRQEYKVKDNLNIKMDVAEVATTRSAEVSLDKNNFTATTGESSNANGTDINKKENNNSSMENCCNVIDSKPSTNRLQSLPPDILTSKLSRNGSEPSSMIAFEPLHPKHHRKFRELSKEFEFPKFKCQEVLNTEPVCMIAFDSSSHFRDVQTLISPEPVECVPTIASNVETSKPDTIDRKVCLVINEEKSEPLSTIAFEYVEVASKDNNEALLLDIDDAVDVDKIVAIERKEVYKPKRLEELCEEALILDVHCESRLPNVMEESSMEAIILDVDSTNLAEEICMENPKLKELNLDNLGAINRLENLIKDPVSSDSLLFRDKSDIWCGESKNKKFTDLDGLRNDESSKRVTPDDERSSDSGFRDKASLSESGEETGEKYNLEDIEVELETFGQLGTPSSDSGLERTPHDDLKSFDSRAGDEAEGDEFWKQQMVSLQQAAGKAFAMFQEAVSTDLSPCEEEKAYASSWFRRSEEESSPKSGDNSYVSFGLDDECVAAIRSELEQKLPKLERQNSDGDSAEGEAEEEVKREDITIHYNIYPVPLSPILEEQESLFASENCSPSDSPGFFLHTQRAVLSARDSLSNSGSVSPQEEAPQHQSSPCDKSPQSLSPKPSRSEQFEADIRAALEQCVSNEQSQQNDDGDEEDVLFVNTETNEAKLVESPLRPKMPYLAFVNGQKIFSGSVDSDDQQWVEDEDDRNQAAYLEQFDAVTSFSEPDPDDGSALWINVPSTRAPMPSPEDEQARRVTDPPPECQTPDWESDTGSEGSSSSGEFVWKEGDREAEVKVVSEDFVEEQQPQPCSPSKTFESLSEFPMAVIAEEDEDNENDTEDDNSSTTSSDTEFIPSSWNSEAAPSRSSLRSPDKKSDQKKNVSFKKQKYHCVYEYPREASDTELEESSEARRHWGLPQAVDYASYADWELLDDDLTEGGDQDTDPDSSEHAKPEPFDFYKLSSIDCDFSNGVPEDGEFFISSSARPFHLNSATFSSQFFPGLGSVEAAAPASPGGSSGGTSSDSTTPPSPLSPASMGELRHTRDRLKLDLPKFSLAPITPKSPATTIVEPTVDKSPA